MNKSDLKNGMIVTLRRGVNRVIIGGNLVDDDVFVCNILQNYNDDLTHKNNCTSEDIMKIEYGGKIIWERSFEWEKVQFGTKVRAWWNNKDKAQVGRFLAYDEDDTEMPFLVFIDNTKSTAWYNYCEIIGEEELI